MPFFWYRHQKGGFFAPHKFHPTATTKGDDGDLRSKKRRHKWNKWDRRYRQQNIRRYHSDICAGRNAERQHEHNKNNNSTQLNPAASADSHNEKRNARNNWYIWQVCHWQHRGMRKCQCWKNEGNLPMEGERACHRWEKTWVEQLSYQHNPMRMGSNLGSRIGFQICQILTFLSNCPLRSLDGHKHRRGWYGCRASIPGCTLEETRSWDLNTWQYTIKITKTTWSTEKQKKNTKKYDASKNTFSAKTS